MCGTPEIVALLMRLRACWTRHSRTVLMTLISTHSHWARHSHPHSHPHPQWPRIVGVGHLFRSLAAHNILCVHAAGHQPDQGTTRNESSSRHPDTSFQSQGQGRSRGSPTKFCIQYRRYSRSNSKNPCEPDNRRNRNSRPVLQRRPRLSRLPAAMPEGILRLSVIHCHIRRYAPLAMSQQATIPKGADEEWPK